MWQELYSEVGFIHSMLQDDAVAASSHRARLAFPIRNAMVTTCIGGSDGLSLLFEDLRSIQGSCYMIQQVMAAPEPCTAADGATFRVGGEYILLLTTSALEDRI